MPGETLSRRQFLKTTALAAGGLTLAPTARARPNARIALGIDVLAARSWAPLRNRRVGLLTHAAGLNRLGQRTVDVLARSRDVRLDRLFAPEHGLEGAYEAGEIVVDGKDRRTGLIVYSLYGATRKPTPPMLAGINTVVIDLQDIGTRSYTYVSAMKLTMEACFEAGIEVVVLDRPNPLGGQKAGGPMIEESWRSYVGPFPTPYLHALTIGEMARMAAATPGWLEIPDATRRQGRLTVIPMEGWRRSMLWTATGLPWVATSPNIPDVAAVLGYPMTGLGAQMGGFRHGIGTAYPFRLLSFPGVSPQELREVLLQKQLPGISYQVVTNGASTGVFTQVTDWRQIQPVDLNFYLMRQAAAWSPENPFRAATESQRNMFNKLVGSTAWWEEITQRGARADVEGFLQRWRGEVERFRRAARRFYLYG